MDIHNTKRLSANFILYPFRRWIKTIFFFLIFGLSIFLCLCFTSGIALCSGDSVFFIDLSGDENSNWRHAVDEIPVVLSAKQTGRTAPASFLTDSEGMYKNTDHQINDFDSHASKILSTKLWGMPTDMIRDKKKGWSLPVSSRTRVEFPEDLGQGPIAFHKGRHRASFTFKTDHPYRAIYKKGRLYYVSKSHEDVFCYYLNQGDQKIREFIFVKQRPESEESLKYTWMFEGGILEYGPDGTILVYEKDRNTTSVKTHFDALDSSMQKRIRHTLKRQMGSAPSFSGKGKLLYTIPAPFFVDGNGAIHKKNIRYVIGDTSTLSLTVALLHLVNFPLLIDPTIHASNSDILLLGDGDGDSFGRSISISGDFNGDGKDDVIVGAPGDDDGGDGSGCVFIFFGQAASGVTIDAEDADIKLVGENFKDYFGNSVSFIGDFNGDGKDDIIIGASGEYPGHGSGCAYIFFGQAASGVTIDAEDADIKLVGEDADDNFGWRVSAAGDFNGDGKDDVIVGADRDDDGGDRSGCAFIFFGQDTSGVTIDAKDADVKLVGEQPFDYFGYGVSDAGDFNGDGKDDVIVGANADYGGSWSGCAYIFFGQDISGVTINAEDADVKLIGADEGDHFGTFFVAVSCAGDFNGDGKDDVIVGAESDDDGGDGSGCAFIFFGQDISGVTIDAEDADVKLVGADAGDRFGYYVSRAGDFNGDGKDDVIVGAPGDDDGGDHSGCAFIFFGQATSGVTIDAEDADVKLVGFEGDAFGISVSGDGDFNGDGTQDIIVGGNWPESGVTGNGRVFVFLFSGPGDELAVDFGVNGLYHYDGSSWTKLSNWNPDDGGMEGWANGLAVDFGANGLYNYDGSSWTRPSSWNPEGMEGWANGLAVDFGSNGLYNYDGSNWTRLTPWNPDNDGMENWQHGLAVDFGANGLYNYDGSNWTKLTGWNPDGMEGWANGLAVDFGGHGLYNFNGSTWTRLSSWNPQDMVSWANGLAVDFGSNGLYNYDGSNWTRLTGWNPEGMGGWANGLAVNFGGHGLYHYDGSSWTKLSSWDSENGQAWGTDIAVDFGGNGLFNYDGSNWTRLTGWNPEGMEDVDLN